MVLVKTGWVFFQTIRSSLGRKSVSVVTYLDCKRVTRDVADTWE